MSDPDGFRFLPPPTTSQMETSIRNVYAMHFGAGDIDRGYAIFDAWLAEHDSAQRPPVSPEVREALVDTLTSPVRAPGSVAASRVFRAETPEDLEDATALADAIFARFSLPVLDAEKVAQWLRSHDDYGVYRDGYLDAENIAAALVADLHTLTTDGAPSDTERNES